MVTPNTAIPVMTAQEAEEAAWGIIKGNSTKSLRFTDETPPGSGNYVDRPVGLTYTGTLAEDVSAQYATDFNTKQIKTYRDSTPIKELVLILNVPSDMDPTDEDDDGNRVLRLSAQGKRALQQECHRLGIERFGVGTQVTITFTGYKANGQGQRPSKTFDITLENIQPFVPKAQREVERVLQATPVAVPQAPVAVPQAPVAAPQAPVAAPQVDPALLAAAQAAQAAPASTGGIVVLAEHIEKVRALVAMNIPRETALIAVTNTDAGGDDSFRAALDNAEANAPF